MVTKYDYKKVNYVFMITVILVQVVSYTGVIALIPSPALVQIMANLMFALPALLYLICIKKSFAPVIRLKPIRVSDVLLCLLAYICLYPVLTFFNAVSMLYSDNVVVGAISGISENSSYFMTLFIVAIMPAFLEEMTYRGVMYNAYRARNPRAAILVSALLFGLMHGNLNQFTYAFLLGMIFILLVEATGSILSSMIVHFLVNGFSATLLYALPRAVEFVKALYKEALSAGDIATIDVLEGLYGADLLEMNVNELFESAATGMTMQEKWAGVTSWFIPALIGGYLGFCLIKKIAKRCGNYATLRAIVRGETLEAPAGSVAEYAALTAEDSSEAFAAAGKREETPDNQPGEEVLPEENTICRQEDKGRNIFTWPLVAGIVIAAADLVLYELIVRGIVKL